MSKVHDFPAIAPETAHALKALQSGVANEGQQKTALEFILLTACGIRNVSYQTGDSHATAFAEGRRFAGLIIAGAMQATPAKTTTRGKRGKPE